MRPIFFNTVNCVSCFLLVVASGNLKTMILAKI